MKKLLFMLVLICAAQTVLANATVTQKEWRWRNDDGNETTATWKAPQGQPVTVSMCSGQNIRLRMVMQVNPDPNNPGNNASKSANRNISYSTSTSGPWTTIFSSSSVFRFSSSTLVTNGTTTTQQLVTSGGTYGAGEIVDSTSTNQLIFNTPAGIITNREYEWVIKPLPGAPAATYYFRYGGANSYPNSYPSLTLTGTSYAYPAVSICGGSYTSPSSNYAWTETGVYNDTIPNAAGCDSVIVTDLTVNEATTSDTTVSSCSSYTLNGTTYTAGGTYTQLLTNAAGCDSTLTLHLTISQPSASTISATACDSYTSPSGDHSWTTSGTYTDVLENAAGCDSTITINLTVNHSSYTNDIRFACDSFTWINGVTYTESTSDEMVSLATANGCDSVITLILTITSINTDITQDGITLTATSPSQSYQWIDCDDATVLQDGADNMFTPAENGFYTVIISQNGCTAIGECVAVTTVGLNELKNNISLSVSPNPTSGIFTLSFTGETAGMTVTDTHGTTVFQETEVISGTEIDLSAYASGVYFVNLQTANGNAVRRVVKN